MTLTTINRRAVVRALAAISATGASGGALALSGSQTPEIAQPALAAAPEPEYAVQRVSRLAADLSEALDDWCADMRETTFSKHPMFEAHVWPASSGRGIWFRNYSMETPEERLAQAQRELIAAMKAAHPEITDWRRVEGEDGEWPMFMLVGKPNAKAVRS